MAHARITRDEMQEWQEAEREIDRRHARGEIAILSDQREGELVAPIAVHIKSSSIYDFGQYLTDIDREFRRTIAMLTTGSTTPVRSIHFELVKAERGNSIDALLEAAGDVLLAAPLQFVMTLDWLWRIRPARWGARVPPQPTQPVHLGQLMGVADRLARAAQAAATQGRRVRLRIDIDPDGSAAFDFRSDP